MGQEKAGIGIREMIEILDIRRNKIELGIEFRESK